MKNVVGLLISTTVAGCATDLLSDNRGGGGGDPLFLRQRAHVLVRRRRCSASNGRRDAIMLVWFRDAFYYAPTRAPYVCCCTILIHIGSSENAKTFFYFGFLRACKQARKKRRGGAGFKLFNPPEISPKVVLSIANRVNDTVHMQFQTDRLNHPWLVCSENLQGTH